MDDAGRAIGQLIEALPDVLILVDGAGRIQGCNARVTELLGHAPADLQGQPLELLVPAPLRARHAEQVRDYQAHPRPRSMASRPVLMALHRDGQVVPVSIALSQLSLPGQDLTVAVLRDAGHTHAQLERATSAAHTDALTGIANRARLQQRLHEAVQAGLPFALLYFDLRAFKPLNDHWGHAAGDEVLRIVARRAQALVREGDLVARLGGDEFVVLLDRLHERSALAVRAQALADALTQPFSVGGLHASIGVNIGGARFPDDAQDAQALLAVADAAMYAAKREGESVRLV